MSQKEQTALSSLLKLEEGLDLSQVEEVDINRYLHERYHENTISWKRRLYYNLKPFIPRFLQLALRKKYLKIQSKSTFPSWPIEPVVVNLVNDYLKNVILKNGRESIYKIAPWPRGKKFAFVITHDVEWDNGLRHAPVLAEIEKKYGFVSSWNIVPQRYPIDWKIVDELRCAGCEIGVHGYSHDGKLFQSKKIFMKRVERINEFAREWNAVGFRAESMLRNIDWMPFLEVEYDLSFPDTDPYEPQGGGCCNIWPYFINHLIEIPLTLPQDHALFEIMGYTDISVWKQKVDWIENNGGLVTINIHPDYMMSNERLQLYENFLAFMCKKNEMWHTLAKSAAQWWRERNDSQIVINEGKVIVIGPIQDRAQIHVARYGNNNIEITPF